MVVSFTEGWWQNEYNPFIDEVDNRPVTGAALTMVNKSTSACLSSSALAVTALVSREAVGRRYVIGAHQTCQG